MLSCRIKSMEMGKKTMVEEWEKLKKRNFGECRPRDTGSVVQHGCPCCVPVLATLAVLCNTGARVAAPVASKIPSFSYFPLESDCDVDD